MDGAENCNLLKFCQQKEDASVTENEAPYQDVNKGEAREKWDILIYGTDGIVHMHQTEQTISHPLQRPTPPTFQRKKSTHTKEKKRRWNKPISSLFCSFFYSPSISHFLCRARKMMQFINSIEPPVEGNELMTVNIFPCHKIRILISWMHFFLCRTRIYPFNVRFSSKFASFSDSTWFSAI